MPGTLYVVATPIGNLGDLSPRAAEVLRVVTAVVAEDTRRTRQLYAHLGARAPRMISLPAFDERARLEPVLALLAAGEAVALCSDAGTPAVSDPGQKLVDAAWEAGARVIPIPGPCAAVASLAASGLRADRFTVLGFLPRGGGGRADAIAELARSPSTAVLYEAGNRTGATLRELAAALGDRRAAVARELTKLHEEIARGSLAELASRFEEGARGEVTIVVEGLGRRPPSTGLSPEGNGETSAPHLGPPPAGERTSSREEEEEPLEEELRRRMAAGEAPSAIAREVARARGLRRGEVYGVMQRMKGR